MISATQGPSRRRKVRRPAGWIMVQVEEGGLDRVVTGRLVDTSEGGLGLVLDQPLPRGAHVRVTRGGGEGGDAPAWERREARVAHTTELGERAWRVGLAFKPEPPSAVQMWATRLLLLGVMAAAAIPAFTLQGSAAVASFVIAGAALALEVGAEWQQRSELRDYRRACQDWETAAAPPSRSFETSSVA